MIGKELIEGEIGQEFPAAYSIDRDEPAMTAMGRKLCEALDRDFEFGEWDDLVEDDKHCVLKVCEVILGEWETLLRAKAEHTK